MIAMIFDYRSRNLAGDPNNLMIGLTSDIKPSQNQRNHLIIKINGSDYPNTSSSTSWERTLPNPSICRA